MAGMKDVEAANLKCKPELLADPLLPQACAAAHAQQHGRRQPSSRAAARQLFARCQQCRGAASPAVSSDPGVYSADRGGGDKAAAAGGRFRGAAAQREG